MFCYAMLRICETTVSEDISRGITVEESSAALVIQRKLYLNEDSLENCVIKSK